eukprot:10329980-Lingulodinium_polyedra.AAC.1
MLAHRLRDDEILRALRTRASVAVDVAPLVVLEASDSEPCSDGANGVRSFGRSTSTSVFLGDVHGG